MRLLLDEHVPAVTAEQLRERGHDVVAVQERADLRGLPDRLIWEAARAERRAICTENVAEFLSLDGECRARQEPQWGLVLTSDRTFPRGKKDTIGALVRALDDLLGEHEHLGEEPSSPVIWLQAP